MMSSKKNNKKNSSDEGSGFGGLVAAGAAVLAGAAIAYGAKKLFDWSTQQEQQQGAAAAPPRLQTAVPSEGYEKTKCCSDSDSYESDSDEYVLAGHPHERRASDVRGLSEGRRSDASSSRDEGLGARSKDGSGLGVGSKDGSSRVLTSQKTGTLCDDLSDYYEHYAKVSPDKAQAAKAVVHQVEAYITERLQSCLPGPLKALIEDNVTLKEFGSAVDETQPINADYFDIMINLELDSDSWSAQSADGSVSIVSGYDTLNRSEMCDGHGCLMSSNVIEYVESAVHDVLSDFDLCVELLNEDQCLLLNVSYLEGSTESKLSINIHPVIQLSDKFFITTSSAGGDGEGCDVRWTEMNFDEELKKMNKISSTSPAQLLTIIKAIHLNFPSQLGVLTSHHYKVILLRLLEDQSEESEWIPSVQSERFIDFLIELGSCCKEKCLPSYFNASVNLMQGIEESALQGVAVFLNRIIGTNDYQSLLTQRKYRKLP